MLYVGVVGVGNLGQHHVRNYVLNNICGSKLVAISEIDDNKRNLISKKYNIESYKNYRELLGKVDAVSIVIPTEFHYEVAKFFLLSSISDIATNFEPQILFKT